MATKLWRIERQEMVARGSLEHGTEPVCTYVPQDGYPLFPTRTEAVRTLMVGLDPDLKGATDAFIQSHYAQHVRNLGHYRVRPV
jgi:hypothetical protein